MNNRIDSAGVGMKHVIAIGKESSDEMSIVKFTTPEILYDEYGIRCDVEETSQRTPIVKGARTFIPYQQVLFIQTRREEDIDFLNEHGWGKFS